MKPTSRTSSPSTSKCRAKYANIHSRHWRRLGVTCAACTNCEASKWSAARRKSICMTSMATSSHIWTPRYTSEWSTTGPIHRKLLNDNVVDLSRCENCGKTFYLKSALRVHRLNHMPKRFECDICQKKFLLLPGLKNHIMIAHVGGKRYECDICGKR